jgi:small subunit ribosomal protein S21
MVVVRKKEKEPFEVMVRRFNRAVQLSGVLSEMKRKRYFERPISRAKRRQIAIRKKERRLAKLREYNLTGQMPGGRRRW